jgi:PadR family transcriptional regulator PadR
MVKNKPLGRDEVRTIVLHVLSMGANHGYAIARTVATQSGEALRLGEGTLYPVLRALESDGLIVGAWETVDAGPARKVYRLTPAGRTERARRVSEWRDRVRAIDAVLSLHNVQKGLHHA